MFSRTSSGIKNTPLFYSRTYLVIVEGTSDKPFWSKFFPEKLNGYKREFKSVGGRLEVQKYIEQLLLTNAKFVVAVDSDYRLLLKDIHNHKRIIETQCHSIENLMLYSLNITTLIRLLSHNLDYESYKVDEWLEKFDATVYPLMIADFLIEQNNLGCRCVGDNCAPFLIGKNNFEFDHNKIDNTIKQLNISQEELDKTNQKLKDYKPRFHIRGHFFFSAVLYFTTLEVKRLRKSTDSISKDSFYTMALTSLESCFPSNPMLQSIRERAVAAAKEVVSLLEEA